MKDYVPPPPPGTADRNEPAARPKRPWRKPRLRYVRFHNTQNTVHPGLTWLVPEQGGIIDRYDPTVS